MLVHQDPPSPAPWRDLFTKHIGALQPPIFTLSTTHPTASGPGPNASVVPRARTCVYRGLWTELPDNEKNTAERNPRIYASDLPVFTTDARMDKMGEILSGGSAAAAAASSEPLSGGGGPVEAVWWASHAATQWRIRGSAWVLGPDIDTDAPGARVAREAVLERMRLSSPEVAPQSWSWQREVTGHFGNLSPGMRGSFRNPPPGRPISFPPREGEGLGQKVDDLHDELARQNFRVVVIVPIEVDQTDLSDGERPRRWVYTYQGGRAGKTAIQPGGEMLGDWEKVEVWP